MGGVSIIFLYLRTSKNLGVGEIDSTFIDIVFQAFLHNKSNLGPQFLLIKYSFLLKYPYYDILQHLFISCRTGAFRHLNFIESVYNLQGGDHLVRKVRTRRGELKRTYAPSHTKKSRCLLGA